jgi:quercetin dioxygenase-like cupin family protein
MQKKMSLEALARELSARAESDSTGRSSTTVFGGHERVLRQTLMAIAAGRSMSEHENPGEATLLVFQGRVRVITEDASWDGRSGDMIVIPDARHSVEAVENSVVLLTVAKLSS